MGLVIVGSRNPVKIEAARRGFAAIFPAEIWDVRGHEVESGVSHQPIGDDETLRGALQRAQAALALDPAADYGVGIEGGCAWLGDDLLTMAWVVVCGRNGVIGRARSGSFVLPKAVAQLVAQGMELGDADDHVFGQSNSKQKNGSIGLLTGDVITRADYYTPVVSMALIPFRPENADLVF
ncbi:MAG: inosine/xanthosine triphosphatase [Anaerolineae bacterium]|jgi:inosine/xanthosine triphosphatase|nr:inosine/xanthosine triphosphatase [Anaerolineae bacterium]